MAHCQRSEILKRAYDGDFQILDVKVWCRHYYRTLSCWYHNFQKVRDPVAADKGIEFVRMWDLYLCGCAVAFYIGYIDVHQLLFTKGTNNDLPDTLVLIWNINFNAFCSILYMAGDKGN